MANALNGHFEMPQTFPAVSIDVIATNMWQLEGCDKVDAQVAHLTGMAVPSQGQVTVQGDERLVWAGRDRYLLTTQRSDLTDHDGVYATDQTYGKTQLLITGEDTFFFLSNPYATAAAVGSSITRMTLSPACLYAAAVAMRCAASNFAGTATTALDIWRCRKLKAAMSRRCRSTYGWDLLGLELWVEIEVACHFCILYNSTVG